MGGKRKPKPRPTSGFWAKLREILSDQQEHSITDLQYAVYHMIRPEVAFKRAWKRSRQRKNGRLPEDLTSDETQGIIRSGVRDIVRNALASKRVHGHTTETDVLIYGPRSQAVARWVPTDHVCPDCGNLIVPPKPLDQRLYCTDCMNRRTRIQR